MQHPSIIPTPVHASMNVPLSEAGLVEELRDLRGLATPRLATHQYHVILPHRLHHLLRKQQIDDARSTTLADHI